MSKIITAPVSQKDPKSLCVGNDARSTNEKDPTHFRSTGGVHGRLLSRMRCLVFIDFGLSLTKNTLLDQKITLLII